MCILKSWKIGCGCLVVWWVGGALLAAAEPDKDPKLAYLQQRLRQHTGAMTGPPAVAWELQIEPLFRWQNPVSGADGAIFVWSVRGRPVVLAKTHVNDRKQHYLESLSPMTAQRFEVRRGEQVVWSPAETGLRRLTIAGVEPPAATKGVRLSQMRAIARRFRMTSFWGEDHPSEWELRLLSTPLHRYAAEGEGVADGAIFGYAQGTNPEGVVLIEAIADVNGLRWEATPARLTAYAVKAWLDDEMVLDVPLLKFTTTDSPFHHHYERPQPYPFAAEP
jgi:hypothetical protein